MTTNEVAARADSATEAEQPAPGGPPPSGASNRTGLKFYEKSHRYKLDGKWVPGVTTILGVLDKPALVKWAAGLVAEFVADQRDKAEALLSLGRDTFVRACKDMPDETKKKAGQRGSTIHDYAEVILSGGEVEIDDDDPLVAVVENAIRFMDDWEIEPLLNEAPVASRQHQWAGKLDLIARYRRPDTGHRGVAIFDWKSGKALYPEYAWQFAAYAHAEFHGENGDEHSLPECDASFGVHVRPDDYDVRPFKFGPDIYAEFLAIRAVHPIVKAGRGDWKSPGSGHVGIAIQKGST